MKPKKNPENKPLAKQDRKANKPNLTYWPGDGRRVPGDDEGSPTERVGGEEEIIIPEIR